MSDAELHAAASDLLARVLAAPADQREAVLAAEVDEAVRAEARSLLQHAALSGDRGRGGGASGVGFGVGAAIGPYRLVSMLGRGGSGYVFLAEQSEPITRRVAIKVAPQAVIDPVAAARFEFERAALEQLDHPNIARVLDAGRTAEGMPYLVMEHVDGPPIPDYCRTGNLSLRDRIALMVQVADAVQHAHQRGLIHRDLTPANILIATVSDGALPRAVPKLLDFGIARPAGGDTARIDVTMGGPIGTPAFMSPEQARGDAVDTRTDVYGLGAVLYTLAAGRPPIDPGADLGTTLHRVQEAALRPLDRSQIPSRASRALVNDLERVLAKAMSRDPQDRYATAAAFAADLQRVLHREPVEAMRPTLAYRAARFYERRRPLVAAGLLALLAAAAGVLGLVSGLAEARRQERIAVAHSESVELLNRFLIDDLLAAASPEESGVDTTAVELVDRAAARVASRFAGRPRLAAEMHHALGRTYTLLGAFDAAEEQLRLAIELRELNDGADAATTLRSRLAMASLLGSRQDFAAAAAALGELVPQARLVLGSDDPALYAALNDLGTVLDSTGAGEKAVSLLEESLAGRKRLLGPDDPAVLITLSNLAQAYDGLGLPRRSLELTIEALSIAQSLPRPPRMLLIGLNNNIGATYQDLSEYDAAAPYLREAARLAETWLGADSPTTWTLLANQAGLEARIGDPIAAAETYRIVAEKRAEALGTDAFDTLAAEHGRWNAVLLAGDAAAAIDGFVRLVDAAVRSLGEEHWFTAQSTLSLARAFDQLGDSAAALRHAQSASAVLERTLGPDHARTIAATELLQRLSASGDGANTRDRHSDDGSAAPPR